MHMSTKSVTGTTLHGWRHERLANMHAPTLILPPIPSPLPLCHSSPPNASGPRKNTFIGPGDRETKLRLTIHYRRRRRGGGGGESYRLVKPRFMRAVLNVKKNVPLPFSQRATRSVVALSIITKCSRPNVARTDFSPELGT